MRRGRPEREHTGTRTLQCTVAKCGDTFTEMGEECDDGNMSNTDACVMGCKLNKCGDKFVNMGVEECDDGNQLPE